MSTIYRRDRQLQSPITGSEIDYLACFKDNKRAIKKEHILLIDNEGEEILKYDYRDFQCDFLQIIEELDPYRGEQRPSLTKPILAAIKALELSETDWMRNADTKNKIDPYDLLDVEMQRWFYWKYKLSSIMDEVCGTTHIFNKIRVGGKRGLQILFYGNLIVIKYRNIKAIGTYEMLLSIKSLVFSHVSLLSYAKVADIYKKYTFKISKFVENYLNAGRKDIHRYSNELANIFKILPSYAIANIISHYDRDLDNDLLQTVENAMKEYPDSEIIKIISHKTQTDEEAHLLLETSGMWKSHIYPVVDPVSSAEKFMEDIKREKPVDAKMANRIRNMFRYKFCKGFFEKNGRWPVVHLLDDVRDDIVTSVKGGQWL